jgi:hypothetical protein
MNILMPQLVLQRRVIFIPSRFQRQSSIITNFHLLTSIALHLKSLKRLDILRETMCCQQIADADFMLRGPGDLLGNAQSGVFQGRAASPDDHWGMIGVASYIGRAFSGHADLDTGALESQSNKFKLWIERLRSGELTSFYDQTDASSERGFNLRFMMALVSDWRPQENESSTTMQAISTLQKLSEIKGSVSMDDERVQQKFASLMQSFFTQQQASKLNVAKPPVSQAESPRDEPVEAEAPAFSYNTKKTYLAPFVSPLSLIDWIIRRGSVFLMNLLPFVITAAIFSLCRQRKLT